MTHPTTQLESPGPLRPERALLHPLWSVSLAVLLVNDQVLKGAGLLPGWLTGKLSDFAGFLLFPMLLGALVRARTQAALWLCHGFAALLLLALELSPGFCALLHRTLGLRLWADPTDLLALFSIAASARWLLPLAARPTAGRQAAARPLLVLGVLACAATSMPPPEPPERFGEVFLWNQRGKEVQVRVSALREQITFSCDAVQAAPEAVFSASSFQVARHVTLVTDGRLLLDDLRREQDGGCHVLLLSVEGAADRLLLWRSGTLPMANVNRPGTEDGVRITEGELRGPAGVLRPGPLAVPPAPAVGCAPPAPGAEPEWPEPIPGPGLWVVGQVSRGGDGCDVLALRSGAEQRRYAICAEPLGVPFSPGDVLSFRRPADGAPGLIAAEQTTGTTLALVRRGGPAAAMRIVEPSPACAPARQACGAARGQRAVLNTPSGATPAMAAGEQTTVRGGGWATTVALRRIERGVVADRACDPAAALESVVSYVWVSKKEMN
jgi:hypothetical protein